MIPAFDQHVERNGYAWWYLDAISDDGRFGLALIAFIGSVFSPYYAWARGRGKGDPLAHCAINVGLYGRGGRWSMTERGSSAVALESTSLRIGPSGLTWTGESLSIDLLEWAVPVPRRVRGRIQVHPTVCNRQGINLDAEGRHRWHPVFPAVRVDVALQNPDIRWSGSGYFDHNIGTEPLENGFDSWYWSRAATSRGPVVLYDTKTRSGNRRSIALHFDHHGRKHELPTPASVDLPRSRWGIERLARSDDGDARIEAVWEDTPFYARSRLNTGLLGERVTAIHESLSLGRFSTPWVRLMLPFRMPRRSS